MLRIQICNFWQWTSKEMPGFFYSPSKTTVDAGLLPSNKTLMKTGMFDMSFELKQKLS